MSKGNLIVFAGSSGVGKGTIMKRLLEIDPNFWLSVSYTTRDPRPQEINGKEYFFVTDEEFDRMIEENGFLEYAVYSSARYGTPKKPVEEKLAEGRDVFLEIEIKGYLQIKEMFPDCLTIFVIPPSREELRRRLVGRKTNKPDDIEDRLDIAEEEIKYKDSFDYAIVNDDIDRVTDEILNIVRSYRQSNC